MQKLWANLGAVLLTLAAAAAVAAAEDSSIGKQISNFTLPNYLGRSISLNDYRRSRLVVVAFLGVDCPLAKFYGPRLDQLSRKYGERGVTFLGINSNRQDLPTEIRAYAEQYGIGFPILKDRDNSIADAFGAERTTEIFVLDRKHTVRYRGRVDNQYGLTSSAAYGRTSQARSDLSEAIEELLAGSPVTVPTTPASGCLIGRVPKIAPRGNVTYANQISRIFQKHCVACHRAGEIGPFPLTSYSEVLGWGEMINEVVQQRRMPPWHADPAYGEFSNERRLTPAEIKLIARWVDHGQPQGDPAELPAPPKFDTGWSIPEPDLVFNISKVPFMVPATGIVEYAYYCVDPGFTEDKWVKAAQILPGNPAVVHHIIASVWSPGKDGGTALNRGDSFIGYAPGQQGKIFPEAVAYRIPAGSKIWFQMHYTSCGIATKDLSRLGIVFCNEADVKYNAQGGVCGTPNFVIPAGDPDYAVRAKQTLRSDTVITGMYPHAHVRGKSFRFEVEYPDGATEVLLDVPRYDFNWQFWYYLKKPKLLPKGSILRTTAHFDNSAGNLFNPDPSVAVTFGEQTSQEMMWGWYSTVALREASEPSILPPPPPPAPPAPTKSPRLVLKP